MSLLLPIIILFSLFLPKAASAQIPLYYQLIEAYKPVNINTSITLTSTPTPTPITVKSIPVALPTPQVLGVTSTGPSNSVSYTPIKVAVLGDSMIDTLGPGMPQLEAALKRYYPNRQFKIFNYGVGASNLEYGFFRLTNDYEYLGEKHQSLISLEPDIVVVESFAYNNFGNSQSGLDQQWLTLGAVTTVLKQKLPKAHLVLASTIAPNSVVFGNGIKDVHFSAMDKIEKSSTIKLYLQNMVNFASSQGFPLANAYQPSLNGSEGRLEFINAGDNLHPSALGGEFFSDIVAKTIFDNKLL